MSHPLRPRATPTPSSTSQMQSPRPLFSQNSTRMSLPFVQQHPLTSPSLLERPENQHMIRWDPAGEHIIVERPEQLALHVLPSIYRQSRFASFSRQLNVGLLLFLPTPNHEPFSADLRFYAQSQSPQRRSSHRRPRRKHLVYVF